MSDPSKPAPKLPPRPGMARAAGVRRVAARPARGHPGGRTGLVFSLLGLIVIASMLFGLVAIGFEFPLGPGGATDSDPPAPVGANLVPTYEARLRDNPSDVNTMIVLANVLQNQGDYPGAIERYDRAVAIKPDDVELRLAFGQALAAYGQLFEGEIQYKKAIELDAGSAKAEYYLSQLYQRSNPPRLEEARIHFARASEIEPEGAWGRAARGALDRLNATPVPARATATP